MLDAGIHFASGIFYVWGTEGANFSKIKILFSLFSRLFCPNLVK